MKKQLIIVGIIVILLTVGISGCIGSSRSIKGTWKDTYDGIWKFTDNTVYINLQSDGKSYAYSIDGDKLYIPDWIGEENYYTMNWIDDDTLELKVINTSISKETLKRYYTDK